MVLLWGPRWVLRFENEDGGEKFLSSLKSLYSLLRFTFEKELNSSFPFLNVLFEKHKTEFITSVENPPLPANRYSGILLAL